MASTLGKLAETIRHRSVGSRFSARLFLASACERLANVSALIAEIFEPESNRASALKPSIERGTVGRAELCESGSLLDCKVHTSTVFSFENAGSQLASSVGLGERPVGAVRPSVVPGSRRPVGCWGSTVGIVVEQVVVRSAKLC